MSEEKKDSKKEVTEKPTADVKKPKVKKKYIAVGPDGYGFFKIGFENGGELPDRLKDMKYTSRLDAEAVVKVLNEGK